MCEPASLRRTQKHLFSIFTTSLNGEDKCPTGPLFFFKLTCFQATCSRPPKGADSVPSQWSWFNICLLLCLMSATDATECTIACRWYVPHKIMCFSSYLRVVVVLNITSLFHDMATWHVRISSFSCIIYLNMDQHHPPPANFVKKNIWNKLKVTFRI